MLEKADTYPLSWPEVKQAAMTVLRQIEAHTFPVDDTEARWEAAYARVDQMSAEEIAAVTPGILSETERRLRERGSHARVADWADDVVRDHVRAVLARQFLEEVQ